jgi:hypothetical protein
MERKIKLGMMVAVEELREDPNSPGYLERGKFKNAAPYELRALQAVYAFLSERKLTYTMSALIEESAVPRSQSESEDVLELANIDTSASQRADDGGSDVLDFEEEEEEEEDRKDSSFSAKGASGQKGAPISRRAFGRNALVMSVGDDD